MIERVLSGSFLGLMDGFLAGAVLSEGRFCVQALALASKQWPLSKITTTVPWLASLLLAGLRSAVVIGP